MLEKNTNEKQHFSSRHQGCGEISKTFFSQIKRNAYKTKNRKEFDLEIEYLWELFLKQDRKCALSGLPISFDGTKQENHYKRTSKRTASLDRIDSKVGYVKGNVQWVHKKVNFMKQSYDQKEFIHLCKSIGQKFETV